MLTSSGETDRGALSAASFTYDIEIDGQLAALRVSMAYAHNMDILRGEIQDVTETQQKCYWLESGDKKYWGVPILIYVSKQSGKIKHIASEEDEARQNTQLLAIEEHAALASVPENFTDSTTADPDVIPLGHGGL
jgi:hypothetical protein